jgi:hypothetical protein
MAQHLVEVVVLVGLQALYPRAEVLEQLDLLHHVAVVLEISVARFRQVSGPVRVIPIIRINALVSRNYIRLWCFAAY